MHRRELFAAALAAASVVLCATAARAFSQQAGRKSEGTPIGHEFITIQSGREVIDGLRTGPRPAKATHLRVPQRLRVELVEPQGHRVHGGGGEERLCKGLGHRTGTV